MWRSVVVFLLIYRVQASQNLAKGKIAYQSSVLPDQLTWNAQKAVDGNRMQNLWCGSCLHTRVTGGDAFLNIDLGGPSAIKRVEIYYRRRYTNKCESDSVLDMTDNGSNYRFKGYRIDIDDVTCYQDRSQPFPEPYQNNSCVGTGVNVKVIQVNTPETEPYIRGPLLELCEVEVYGCQIGWYGPGCNDPCDMKCLEGMCDPDNGDCLRGCIDGYRGQQCNLECNDGWFGANCSSTCANCFNQSCRHTNGVCPQGCDKGYIGSNCNQSCSEGWFGYNCSRRCGKCSAGAYCDRVTGDCPAGCETGYEAPLCLEECPVYTYGENCGMICGKCKHNSTCHHVTGICSNGCEAGWIEEQCQTFPTSTPAPASLGPGRSDIACEADSITSFVPVDQLPVGTQLTWRDPACGLTSNGTHLLSTIGHNQCGTTVKITQNSVEFENELIAQSTKSTQSLVDFGDSSFVIPVKCIYPRQTQVATFYQPTQQHVRFYEKRYGHFDVDIVQYKTDKFVTPVQDLGIPRKVPIKSQIYVEAGINDQYSSSLGIHVDQCIATRTPSPSDSVYYSLIKDGCPIIPHVTLYNSTNSKVRFGVEAFRFVTANASDVVYIHCQVSVCDAATPHCAVNCMTSAGRRRRAAAGSGDKTHLLSTGPFMLVVDDQATSLSSSNLVAAISALVAVIACIVAIIGWTRRRHEAVTQPNKL